jgi:hypothetical protein
MASIDEDDSTDLDDLEKSFDELKLLGRYLLLKFDICINCICGLVYTIFILIYLSSNVL